jgi:hypothetical protein
VSDYFVNLASQLAARYDNDPDFAGIYVAGVNAQYPEMIFSSSPAWANAAAPPPNGIATTVDDVDPPLTPDAAGAALYANAWLRNARLMATQFRQSRIVNMLDAMIALPSAVQYDALDSIYQTINGTYSAHATMGTANLGDPDVISLSAHKYVVLDSSYPGNETPVFYEIGPRKVDTTNTHSLADAVRACAQGTATGELGCTAVTIFNSSWYGANQDVGDVGTASCEVWGGTACP